MGSISPSFPAVRTTRSAATADSGKVRMRHASSPSFPAVRADAGADGRQRQGAHGLISPSSAVRVPPRRRRQGPHGHVSPAPVHTTTVSGQSSALIRRPFVVRRAAAGMLSCPSDPGRTEAVMDQPSPDVAAGQVLSVPPRRARAAARGPFGRRLDADARIPLLRGDAHRLRARLVRLSADEFQADVGRRQRRRLELRGQ